MSARQMKFKWIFLPLLICFANAAETKVVFESMISEPTPKDTLRLKLQEAVLMALERNPNMAIQRMDPAITKSYADEERAAFDPSFSASATWDETKLQRFLGSRPAPFEMTSTRTQYDVGLAETLPTGTSLSVNASMSGSLSSIYTDQYSGNIGLTVTQSLLQGFGVGVNLANLRKARLDVEISQEELKAFAEGLVSDVEKAYWDLYLKAEEIAIQQQSFELANRQLKETLERVAVGKLAELELASIRAEVANRKEALIDAQSQYEQARLYFLFLLNPEEQTIWSVLPVPLDKPFIPEDSLDALSVHEQLGMLYRPDLKQARLNVQKGELEIVQTKNGLLPRLDLFITLGKTSYAKTFKEALPDIQSPFYNVNVGATFTFPIPNRQARAQATRARKSKEQMELSLSNMEKLVQWDIRSAYIEVLRLRQQIEATRVTRELQDQNLAAEVEKFRVGKSTNLQVLQVQRDFTTSQLDEIRAMVLYLDSLIDLYVMEGSLLERRGIHTPSGF